MEKSHDNYEIPPLRCASVGMTVKNFQPDNRKTRKLDFSTLVLMIMILEKKSNIKMQLSKIHVKNEKEFKIII